jgi:hypothetical protein
MKFNVPPTAEVGSQRCILRRSWLEPHDMADGECRKLEVDSWIVISSISRLSHWLLTGLVGTWMLHSIQPSIDLRSLSRIALSGPALV